MKLIICCLMGFLIVSCQSKKTQKPSILNTNNLPIQSFEIDINRDTIVRSNNGARIYLPKGTLKSDSSVVKLYLKEAYSMQQMILSGLNTKTTDGKALQSGGMFYLAPSDSQKVSIIKPIQMQIPTDRIIDSMKLFKANESKDGNITWEQPFEFKVKSPARNPDGKALFQNNCASCHSVLKDATGPALINITRKRTREYLLKFTNNWEDLLAHGDCVAIEAVKWSNTAMPKFNFSEKEIDAIYDYVAMEDASYVDDGTKARQDSCQKYKKMKMEENELLEKKYQLKNKRLIKEIDSNPPSAINDTTPVADSIVNLVETVEPTSEYYDIEIRDFGWVNIDIITDDLPNVANVSIKVPILNQYEDYIKTYLIFPDKKIKLNGHLKKNNYVFGDKDDSLKMVLGEQAYVLAMGEKDGQFIYSKVPFTTAKQQTILLQIKESSIYEFNADMRRMGWTGLDIKATESKNKGEIEHINYQLQKIEKSKPSKDCDCSDFKKKVLR